MKREEGGAGCARGCRASADAPLPTQADAYRLAGDEVQLYTMLMRFAR